MRFRIGRPMIACVLATVIVSALGLSTVSAQYVISARAGLVNYAGPEVQFRKPGESSWLDVQRHQQLDDGDLIRTGEHSRAELLLNPGSYLRMNYATELKVNRTDFDGMAFELQAVSAIVEAGGSEESFALLIRTRETLIRLNKGGLYRIDLQEGLTELAIHKGKASYQVGGTSERKIGDGNLIKLGNGAVASAKLENVGKDEFDYWSQDRAETLIAANRAVVRSTTSSFMSPGNGWFYSNLFGMYTFLPLWSQFNSPYFTGYGYWWPGYLGGYGGGRYFPGFGGAGGGGGGTTGPNPFIAGKKLDRTLYSYANSPKDPGHPIRIADPGQHRFEHGRFSSPSVYADFGGASRGSGHMSAPPSMSAPAMSAHQAAPAGRGKH